MHEQIQVQAMQNIYASHVNSNEIDIAFGDIILLYYTIYAKKLSVYYINLVDFVHMFKNVNVFITYFILLLVKNIFLCVNLNKIYSIYFHSILMT